jgi:U3 small nucleolar RNA-associated protein 3
VFALRGLPSSESDEDEDYDVHQAEDEDEEDPPQTKVKGKAKAKLPLESDDEESEGEEESWGRKKSAYYSSNAAELDSEDEEANQLEEQEARRIQTKARDVMQDDDFGLADIDREDAEDAEECVPLLIDTSTATEVPLAHCLNPRLWLRCSLSLLTRKLPLGT